MKKRYPAMAVVALLLGTGIYTTGLNPVNYVWPALKPHIVPPEIIAKQEAQAAAEVAVAEPQEPVEVVLPRAVPTPIQEPTPRVEPPKAVFDDNVRLPPKKADKVSKVSKEAKKRAPPPEGKCIMRDTGQLRLIR